MQVLDEEFRFYNQGLQSFFFLGFLLGFCCGWVSPIRPNKARYVIQEIIKMPLLSP
jgi:hypothetical protein